MSYTVFVGPMFGGKTSRGIDHAYRIAIANDIDRDQIVFYKPSTDTRGTGITSHIGIEVPATVLPKNCAGCLTEAPIVVFDEAQFYTGHLRQAIEKLLARGTHVVAMGLLSDAYGNQFGHLAETLYLADSIVHCKAVCTFCKRLDTAAFTVYQESVARHRPGQVKVGGTETYRAACSTCRRDNAE